MRAVIRANRATDRRHRMLSHFDVIQNVTNMWWNPRLPINEVLKRNANGCWACHSAAASELLLPRTTKA